VQLPGVYVDRVVAVGGQSAMKPLNPPPDGMARRPRTIDSGLLVNLGIGDARATPQTFLRPRGRCVHPGRETASSAPARLASPERGRSRPRRRQQPAHHTACRARRSSISAWSFAMIRGRPHRHHHPRCLRGGGQRRPRQLGHAGARQGAPRRRRPWTWRRAPRAVVGHHGAQHGARGGSRLVETCTLPLTAVRCVKRVFHRSRGGRRDAVRVSSCATSSMGLSRAELQKNATGAPLAFAPDCRTLAPPPLPDAE